MEYKWTEIARRAGGCWRCFVARLATQRGDDELVEDNGHWHQSEKAEMQRPSEAMAEGIEHMLAGMRILRESCKRSAQSIEGLARRLLEVGEPGPGAEWRQDSGLGLDSDELDELDLPSTPPVELLCRQATSSWSRASLEEDVTAPIQKRKSSRREEKDDEMEGESSQRKRRRLREQDATIAAVELEFSAEEHREDDQQSKQQMPAPAPDAERDRWRAEASLLQSNIVAEVQYMANTKVTHQQASRLEEEVYDEWLVQYEKNDERGVARDIRRIAVEWKDRCGLCWVEGRETVHTWDKCMRTGPTAWKAVDTDIKTIQDKILCKSSSKAEDGEWQRSSGCWRCGMPAWMCSRFEFVPGQWYQRKAGDQGCKHGGVLAQMVSAICIKHPIGAALVIAQKKIWAGQERVRLDSENGVDWLVDWDTKSKPEASNFVYVAVELERYARVARGISHGI